MRLALFDLDGTLIDSEAGIVNSIEYALARLGASSPPRATLRGWIGPPLRATFPLVLGDDPARTEQAVAHYSERFSAVGWREHRVYDGIGDVVDDLAARGVALAVVTTKVERHVAVKLLQPGLGDPAFRERFLREARLLAGLRHPNIVEVHDFDVSSGDVPYYVMDYLEGESLAGELARAPRGLPWARCAEVLRGVVPALTYAHARGVVHRDLKPDNIFVTHAAGREQVRLLDFGIARFVEDSEEAATRLTQTGLVIGTPQYFAPEQFYGYPVTLATDQYALALIVAEMLRGRPLRSGRSFSEISLEGLARAPASITAELPASTPTHVAEALGRALAVDPAQRHAEAAVDAAIAG